MAVSNLNTIIVSNAVNGESDNFSTSQTIVTNNMTKVKFTLADADTTGTVNTFATRAGLKYIGVQSETAHSNISFKNGSTTIVDFGLFNAGQVKHAVTGLGLDVTLPSSGSDITSVVATKSDTTTGSAGEINIEMYFNS
jgi:hypothetical protein